MGLKAFNSLPTYMKDISCNLKEFKHLLKNCLYSNSFYTLEDYFHNNNDNDNSNNNSNNNNNNKGSMVMGEVISL